MKKISILLLTAGVIFIVGCLIYFKPTINAVDSDPMTVSPAGVMVSEWPIFIGIILTFVGGLFFYVSNSEKKIK
jgi:uncharacterized membrane protein